MSSIAYTVRATCPSPALAERYVAWLEDGHVDMVIRGGAHAATIVRLDPEPGQPGGQGPRRVEVRYVFPTRAVFDRYVRDFAPALRAEGLARFGRETGVTFERSVGEIV